MTKDEVKKLRMDSPESLQFLNNATKFYNLMMMYRCAIREIQTKLEVLDDEFSVENNRNPISFIKTLSFAPWQNPSWIYLRSAHLLLKAPTFGRINFLAVR